jgi:Ca2+-binding RTX toxin-like protein
MAISITAEQFKAAWVQLDAIYVQILNSPTPGAGGAVLSGVGYDTNIDPFTLASSIDAVAALGAPFDALAAILSDPGAVRGDAALAVNLAFMELGNAYVAYLSEDHPAILDIAKLRPNGPGQSFHDNILGNVTDGATNARFPSAYGDGYELTEDVIVNFNSGVRTEAAEAFGTRPIYSGTGTAGDNALLGKTIAFDLAAGLSPAQIDLDGRQGDIVGDRFFVVTTSGVVTGYPDEASARAAAAASADSTFVNTEDALVTTIQSDPTGTAGNDWFVAEAGNQTIEGGEGSDTYSVAENNDGGAFVDLSSGIAFGGAETGFDNLQSIENVAGGDGDDVIYGNSGDNVFFASAGEDQIDGRGGNDAFNASSATGDVEIDLTAGTATGAGIDTTLVSVERAIGGQGNDTLVGTVGDNILVGGAGNDTIETLGGNDIVQGGEGTDKLVLDVASGDATIAFINGAWTVTTGEGETAATVILTGVEEVQFNDSTSAWLLGGGSELSINAAIDNAENNDSVYLASGSYTAVGQLSIDASIKIVGSGEGATTIVAGSTAWGLLVTADNVSIEDLTIDAGAVSTYGVKVQPDSSDPADSLTNFSMSDVTVSGANRSEIDLNGVDGANLTNVTVDGQNTGGVGIGISDSTGVVLTNIEALGNNWGSVGLYTKGANWTPGTSDITIVGDYSKLQDSIKIYSDEEQNEGEAGVTNLDLSGILGTEVWKVENNDYRSRADDFTFFFGSEAEAVAHAIELGEASIVTGPVSSVGLDTETELTFVVRDGMSIQAALDRAPDGATIYIGAGEYDENLVIKSGVTIIADDGAIVSPANGAAISFGDLDGASVSISGLTLDDGDYGVLIEAGDNIGTLDLDGVNILNQSSNAVFVFGNGVASLNMTGGTLSNNGTTEGNTAQVKLYSFSNDASFVDVTVTGGAPSDPIRPDGAFELVGIENVSISDGAPAIGAVVFDNVTVTGEFNNVPVGIYNYSDLSGLSIDGSDAAPGLDLSGTNSGWTSPSGAPLGLNIDGITSDIDASGYEVVGPDGGIAVVLQGEKAGQTPANGQNFTGTAGDDVINGKLGDDVIDGNGGNDFISGGEGTDTARFDAGTGQLKIVDGLWVLEKDGVVVSTLHDVERVEIGSDVYLLVDQLADGGFTSVQAAIDAAAGGETILVAAGENPYVESADFTASPTAEHAQGLPGTNSGNNPLGLLINKSVTLQGVDSAGNLVNAASEDAPVIQSERQSGWGTHFFVTADDVSINGLTLEATPTAWNGSPLSVINKVVEVVGDNFVLTGSTVGAPGEVDVASSVYVNDRSVPVGTGSNWVSQIQTLTIDGNIVEGSVVVANGVGLNGANEPSELILVVNNQFVNNNADPAYRGGIIITGNDDQVAWRNAEVAMPVVEGNTFNDPNQSYLYARSDDLNFMPDREFVDDFIADNTIETYAFVTNDGDSLQYHDAQTDLGGGNIAHSNGFTLHKDVGSASADAEEGNAVLVSKSADEAGTQTIVTDGLTVKELNADTDLTLELGAGVSDIALADFAEGEGANVNVTGNAEDNAITGNSGDNVLDGGAGNDSFVLGGGSDTVVGGAGTDSVQLDGSWEDYVITVDGGNLVLTRDGETTTIGGVEVLEFAEGQDVRLVNFAGSEYSAIDAALADAAPGEIIFVGGGSYGAITVDKAVNIIGAPGADVEIAGVTYTAGGAEGARSTLEGVEVTGVVNINGQDHIGLHNVVFSNQSGYGLNFSSSSNDVSITDGIFNIGDGQVGIKVATTADVSDLVVKNTEFNGGYQGIHIANDSNINSTDTVSGRFENLTFNGQVTQNSADSRAIYAEKMSDVTFTGIVVNAPASVSAAQSERLRGIEVNFKYGSFENVSFDGVTFNGFGAVQTTSNDPLLSVHAKPGAIVDGVTINGVATDAAGATYAVAIFTEALPYSGASADGQMTGVVFTNADVKGVVSFEGVSYVAIEDNTVDGDMFLLRVDQPAGEAASLATNDVSGTIKLFDNESATLPEGADDLELIGTDNIDATGNAGDNVLTGNAGNNVLEGGEGVDTYVGGDGVDTVKLGFDRENVDLSDLVSSGEITSDDGVETVSGVEILEFADSASEGRVLIVGANGFATLQDAIDAATGLDTILLSEGAFGGGVIGASKAGLTIVGIRAEDDAAGRTGSESVIDGNLLVQAEGVRIEGVKFSKDGAGAALTAAATGLVVVNSLFVQDAAAYSGIGIETNIGGAGSGLDVSGSAFHGWATGIYVNGGENIAVGDNLFDGNNVGVSVDAYPGSSNISVSGNAFANSGFEHVGVGLFDAVVDAGSIVGPNTFDASVREVGLYGLNGGGQSISGTEHSDGVFAGSGNDTFIYEIGQGSDTFDGGAGSDTLKIDASSVAGDGTVTIGSSSLSVGSLTVNYNSVERFDITLGAGNHEVDASGSAFDQLTLNMGGGDDIYRAAAGLGHTLNGGDGDNDLIDYSGLSNGLNIILNGTVSGSGVSHTLSGFENVRGSTGNDSIVGTTGNNVFLASNGTDFISAGGGVDTFDASSASAAVIAFLNEGSAWGSASWGSNSTSLRHVENLKGSDFDDVLEGNSSANELHGGLGNDRLAGYGGDDFIFGGDGIDTAVFDGGIGSYRIDTATKTIIGSDGTTVLDGVEKLEFNGFAFDWDYKVGIGDFDGDGTQDQLIKNPNGWHYVTDGDALVGVGFQSVAAVGDFNGDGKDDILTYSSSGWLGYIKPGVGGVGLRSLPNHEILAVGDLDGDGKDDILMMNKGNGYLSAQVNGGTTYMGLGGINGREVIGLADLNGDNSQDVIFKSASGWVAAYDLANNSYTNIGFQIGRDLIGVGDFNGDGKDDLLFQTVDNSNGGTIGYTSYLSGGGANVGVGMLGAGAVLAVGNYDGNATDDIFLLNGDDSISVLPSGLVSQQQAVTDLMLDEVLDFGNGTRVDDDMFIA